MRILYVNHTAQVSGAERSLLELLAGLPPWVEGTVACPPGPLSGAAELLNRQTVDVPNIEGSFRLAPWQSSRAVLQIVRGGASLRRLARQNGMQLLHANSARAGLMTSVAARLGGPPAVVSIRDCMPSSRTGRAVRRIILRNSQLVIANSRYTALNFCGTFDASRVIAIHNPVNLGRFDPGLLSKQDARTKLGLDLTVPVLGVLAQLAPWKGQDDAIHSVALLRKRFPGLQLLLVGEVKFPSKASRYDNRRYAQSLNQLVDNLELTRNVHFLGEREDVPSILRALDLLLVPSWEEPFGRSVIEGMAMETPVVATQIGGTTEIISHGIDGLLLPPRMPALWADVIAELLADPERRLQLGSTGRKRVVEAFRVELHVRAVLRAYDRVLGGLEN